MEEGVEMGHSTCLFSAVQAELCVFSSRQSTGIATVRASPSVTVQLFTSRQSNTLYVFFHKGPHVSAASAGDRSGFKK